MIKILYLITLLLIPAGMYAQQAVASPAQLYGDLFRDVQMAQIFKNSKQFADAEPRQAPQQISSKYLQLKDSLLKGMSRRLRKNGLPAEVLETFVKDNFELSTNINYSNLKGDTSANLESYAKNLWKPLTYSSVNAKKGGSLIALPNPYIASGRNMNEMHYWDSYFIMLGLKESGQHEMVANMVNNFAFLIDQYGHIPASNRTYHIGRSQPPFFSLMLDLLAEIKGESIYLQYLPHLEKEYLFWMDGADSIKKNQVYKRVAKFNDGTVMNRYGDEVVEPREEFYYEDMQLAENNNKLNEDYLLNIRAASESGWYSCSRWLQDIQNPVSVEAISLLPVDLNCLLLHMEYTLRNIYKGKGQTNKVLFYAERMLNREVKLDFLFWNKEIGFYCDYDMQKNKASSRITLAGLFPLLFKNRYREIGEERIEKIVEVLKKNLLVAGGGLSTNLSAPESLWDAPFGSAPLQWALIASLEKYGYHALAEETALNWVNLSLDVYAETGRSLKHYDVVNTAHKYKNEEMSFDGVACNNGLLLYLISKYQMRRALEKK
jgi:alpha,alpha-trehalase